MEGVQALLGARWLIPTDALKSETSAVKEKHVKNSRFLSWALRHAPERIGLKLNSQGWADIAELIRCSANHGVRLTRDIIQEIVEGDEKGRYGISPNGKCIRALYGHSLEVDLGLCAEKPPRLLYHGTATRFLESVMSRGLNSGRRQYVHLSTDQNTAAAVGRRHGKPVTLAVDAESMHRAGIEFYQMAPGTWLVREVPARFIRVEGFGNVSDRSQVAK